MPTATAYRTMGYSSTAISIGNYTPYAFIYAATGNDGNVHLYSLNISNASSVPVPQQISSLSLSSMSLLCQDHFVGQTSSDPTTGFGVLHIAGKNGTCGTSAANGDVWEVVHYTDSATTAPIPVGITTTTISALHAPAGGVQTGLLLFDSASGNLYLYADDTFTNPKTLVSGVTATTPINAGIQYFWESGEQVPGTIIFQSVTTATGTYLYRIDYTGAASNLYTAQGSLSGGTRDDNNFYFADTVGTPSPTSETFIQVPLAGGSTTKLYSFAPGVGSFYNLWAANDSVLIFSTVAISGASETTTVATVPVGKTSNSANTIGSYSGIVSGIFLVKANGAPLSAANIVVDTSVLSPPVGQASHVLTPSGTVVLDTSNSVYFPIVALGGIVCQLKGITDTSGGWGGGTLYNVDATTFATTGPFTTSGGGVYTVQTGAAISMGTVLNGSTIGAGYIQTLTAPVATSGSAYDLSKLLIVPVSVSGSNVLF